MTSVLIGMAGGVVVLLLILLGLWLVMKNDDFHP